MLVRGGGRAGRSWGEGREQARGAVLLQERSRHCSLARMNFFFNLIHHFIDKLRASYEEYV